MFSLRIWACLKETTVISLPYLHSVHVNKPKESTPTTLNNVNKTRQKSTQQRAQEWPAVQM